MRITSRSNWNSIALEWSCQCVIEHRCLEAVPSSLKQSSTVRAKRLQRGYVARLNAKILLGILAEAL